MDSARRPYLVVLGIAQDAGYPAAGCRGPCCMRAWGDATARRHVSCLAIVDPQSDERWLLDCTPDFREQLRILDGLAPVAGKPGISGILLTHAHIGHYAGLIHLGREAMNTSELPVYAMPRMRSFLENNEPWRQLESNGNIALCDLAEDHTHAVKLMKKLGIHDRVELARFAIREGLAEA